MASKRWKRYVFPVPASRLRFAGGVLALCWRCAGTGQFVYFYSFAPIDAAGGIPRLKKLYGIPITRLPDGSLFKRANGWSCHAFGRTIRWNCQGSSPHYLTGFVGLSCCCSRSTRFT